MNTTTQFPQSASCLCGCNQPATFSRGADVFATVSCRARFWRRVVQAARNGHAIAIEECNKRAWPLNAHIGVVGRKGVDAYLQRAAFTTSVNLPTTPPASAKVRSSKWHPQHAQQQASTSTTSPAPAARAPKAPRVPKARRLPRVFEEFISSRCKSLPLAAKVLGISPRPPIYKSALRAAWIELISKHHPDKGGAIEAAQCVNAAYQLLQQFAS